MNALKIPECLSQEHKLIWEAVAFGMTDSIQNKSLLDAFLIFCEINGIKLTGEDK